MIKITRSEGDVVMVGGTRVIVEKIDRHRVVLVFDPEPGVRVERVKYKDVPPTPSAETAGRTSATSQ